MNPEPVWSLMGNLGNSWQWVSRPSLKDLRFWLWQWIGIEISWLHGKRYRQSGKQSGCRRIGIPIYLFEALSSLKHLHVARESVACYASSFIVSKPSPFSLGVEFDRRVTGATSSVPQRKTFLQLERLSFHVEEAVVEWWTTNAGTRRKK